MKKIGLLLIGFITLMGCYNEVNAEPIPSISKDRFSEPTYLKISMIPEETLQIPAGKDFGFEAYCTGNPIPISCKIFRDNTEIHDSGRYNIIYLKIEDGFRVIVVIKEAYPEDSGIYTVKISNGPDSASADLYVVVYTDI